MRLGEAIDKSGLARFDTKQQFLNALHPVFEDQREATANGLIAQLRALVPF
jgi:hypothetical protein